MASEDKLVHVVMISFPAQGHITPMLRLAKALASKGFLVTFTTTEFAGWRMQSATSTNMTATTIGQGQLRFEFFSDGLSIDEKERFGEDLEAALNTTGRDSFTQLLLNNAKMGRPVSCIVNNPFLYWASDVAAELGIPCALQWVHSCAVYSIYHHYINGLTPFPTPSQPDLTVHIPQLPPLRADDIPSFLHPFFRIPYFKRTMVAQMEALPKYLCIFIDSFEELESDTIKTLSHTLPTIRSVGPLLKAPYVAQAAIQGDLFKAATNCMEWLDLQPPASVVYVSFGSIVVLQKEHMEELAYGLLNSGLHFLWVVRPANATREVEQKFDVPDLPLLPDGFIEAAKGKGLVVPWCPQEQVLVHPSVACFVSQCGWNSSLECLSSGLPVVEFSLLSDQVTNAKFLVDVYGVGVRIAGERKNEKRTLTREDVVRALEEVTRGEKAVELKRNALRWKKAAEAAVAEGGSSDRTLQAAVDEIRKLAINHGPKGSGGSRMR